jgi:hypothetical protein
VITLQIADPSSHQRGRPTETGKQIPDPNSWKGSNIWSNVHKVRSKPRHIDRLSAVKWLWLWKSSLSSERAPHRGRTTNSRPKLLKRKQHLVKCPQSGLDTKTYWLTDWLTVSRKVTLTLKQWLSAVKWLWLWSKGLSYYLLFLNCSKKASWSVTFPCHGGWWMWGPQQFIFRVCLLNSPFPSKSVFNFDKELHGKFIT